MTPSPDTSDFVADRQAVAAFLRKVLGPSADTVLPALTDPNLSTMGSLIARIGQSLLALPQPEQVALLKRQAGLLESSALTQALASYQSKFGWPFVLAIEGPRGLGLSAAAIESTLVRRSQRSAQSERLECMRQLTRRLELELTRLLKSDISHGEKIWDWHEALATHSDVSRQQPGVLTVTYLTEAHLACARDIAQRMQDCGCDEVSIDAVGNVVGIYHGQSREAKRLLTGSHYDTVRNGGKYDGRLGIFLPLACIESLHQQQRRLKHGIEVVAFAEEEGQRYKATFLASAALTGEFNPDWLEQTDSQGVTMRDALLEAGHSVDQISGIRREPGKYLGFVEVHIEQGPVLSHAGLPLGVVTSINGGVRFLGKALGMASHAGTTPMGQRADAAAAVAEVILLAEQAAQTEPDAVATVGMLQVPSGSINVVPGACHFSLDVRAPNDADRDRVIEKIRTGIDAIQRRRGVAIEIEEIMRAAAAPSDSRLQAIWEAAVSGLGLPVRRMPSGAGHDAMKLHNIMPQAMLFVRGENDGISHNPLESTTSHDMDVAYRATLAAIEKLCS